MTRSIKRWIIGLIIIIVILSGVVFYYANYSSYEIDDWYSVISAEQAKNITNSFLKDNSLTKYHINNVTDKFRERIVDSQINIFDQENNSIGWVIVSGGTGKISNININEIEIDGSDYIKISPNLWQMISVSNKSSYCKCVLNLLQPFSENDKKLIQKQEFEIHFENNTALKGVFPINKINNIINNGKIKIIDYGE